MPNTSTCPFCQTQYTVYPVLFGKTLTCKNCKEKFIVTSPEDSNPDKSRPVNETSKVTAPISNKSETGKHDIFIGKLALFYKFINEEQLREALAILKWEEESGRPITLGNVFIKRKILSTEQIDILNDVKGYLKLKRLEKRFGSIAIKKKFISTSDIEKALQIQKNEDEDIRRMIGNILVEIEVLDEKQRDIILDEQNQIKIKLPSLESLIKRRSAREGVSPAHPGTGTLISEVNDSLKEINTDEPAVKVEKGIGIQLNVSNDNLTAYIQVDEKLSVSFCVEKIKNLLLENGISYGIIDNAKLISILNDKNMTGKKIKIAEGKPSKPGRDASVQYFFNVDYLKAGTVKDGGEIDFKDRGEIPHANTGDILAKKLLMINSEPGVDIFGNLINTKQASDVAFSCGTGAELSEDSLTAIAVTDGQPKVSMGGKISVYKELRISSDIGYETGHVEFDGNIIVDGAIQEGFRVKGVNLKTNEILATEIDVSGDIHVSGGIIGASIKCGGNIRATYIKEANIHAYGNIHANKEILDSEIVVSGACYSEKGKIISSTVSAKKGIYAHDIGTHVSRSSKLRVGVDDHLEKEISQINIIISEKEEILEKLTFEKLKLDDDIQEKNQKISALTQEKKQVASVCETIRKALSRFKTKRASRQLDHAETQLRDHENMYKKAEDAIGILFEEQAELDKKISEKLYVINIINIELDDLRSEKNSIIEYSQENKGIPIIKVSGSVYAKTIVAATNAITVLQESFSKVNIKEVKVSYPDGKTGWEIQVVKPN